MLDTIYQRAYPKESVPIVYCPTPPSPKFVKNEDLMQCQLDEICDTSSSICWKFCRDLFSKLQSKPEQPLFASYVRTLIDRCADFIPTGTAKIVTALALYLQSDTKRKPYLEALAPYAYYISFPIDWSQVIKRRPDSTDESAALLRKDFVPIIPVKEMNYRYQAQNYIRALYYTGQISEQTYKDELELAGQLPVLETLLPKKYNVLEESATPAPQQVQVGLAKKMV